MAAALLVFVGGGLGALLRYLLGLIAPGPLTTLAINVVGCFLIGLLVLMPAGNMRLFLAVGLLGGFTTFSAFSLETFLMIERGEIGLAGSYIAASVIGAIAFLYLGLAATRAAA